MRWFYKIYQYIAFLILYPLSIYIWYLELHSLKKVLLIVLMPLIVAYIIPFLGTNVTKLWRFNTRFKLGNFRIYHGFVLSAFVNLFGCILYVISPEYKSLLELFFFALISGSFMGFWNWYYDIYAVKSGFMMVNNKLAHEKKSAHEIVTDYAPIYFFMFGFMYGIYIKVLEYHFNKPIKNYWIVELILIICSLVFPTLIYAIISKIRHGVWGISYYKED